MLESPVPQTVPRMEEALKKYVMNKWASAARQRPTSGCQPRLPGPPQRSPSLQALGLLHPPHQQSSKAQIQSRHLEPSAAPLSRGGLTSPGGDLGGLSHLAEAHLPHLTPRTPDTPATPRVAGPASKSLLWLFPHLSLPFLPVTACSNPPPPPDPSVPSSDTTLSRKPVALLASSLLHHRTHTDPPAHQSVYCLCVGPLAKELDLCSRAVGKTSLDSLR